MDLIELKSRCEKLGLRCGARKSKRQNKERKIKKEKELFPSYSKREGEIEKGRGRMMNRH